MIITFTRLKHFIRKLLTKSKEPDFVLPQPHPTQNLSSQSQSSPAATSHSRRAEDLTAEHQLAFFMDKYLYARFPTRSLFTEIERVHDKEEQLNGVDVKFVGTDGRTYYIDEKAQLYYLNKDLPTFAFEVLFKRGSSDTTGWLCNPALKTDFYMLIWPFATQDTSKGITWDKFTKTDCLLISKKRILNALAAKGLTTTRMLQDANKIRAHGQIGKLPIPGVKGIYYYASDPVHYHEAPINIIISKSILEQLAQRRYIVTAEQVISK